MNRRTHGACQVQAKEKHACATTSEHQYHRRLCTPCHAEVKLWYTKSTLITQQHYNSTWTPPSTWTYQHCLVKWCYESSWPHRYYGPYCCNQCNVMWKSKRPTCNLKSHVKLKGHESQTIMRANFNLVYIYPSFVYAKDFSPWLLPHSVKSL